MSQERELKEPDNSNNDVVGRRGVKNKDHHLPNKQGFTNPWDSFIRKRASLSFIKWMVCDAPKVPLDEPNLPPMSKPDWDAIRNPNKSKIQVTWIGHASFLIQMDGLNILTDPVFSQRCSPSQLIGPKRIRPVPFPEEQLPEIDLVVISHNHYDHLDTTTVLKLKDKVKCWYVPLEVAKWFKNLGVGNVVQLDWWDECQFTPQEKDGAGVSATIVCTPCQHFSGRTLWDSSKTLWASWVVITANHRIYFAGDTGYKSVPEDVKSENDLPVCPAFKEIGQTYGPFDLACIPIGAYCPRSFLSRVHLDPEDAVSVHMDVRSRQSVAMHWGTFILSAEPVMEPIERLAYKSVPEDVKSENDLPVCPAFKEIGQTYGPFDLACIPIGAYCPRSFLSRVHLDPEDAVSVHMDVRSRQSVAMHWGTFILSAEPVMEPIERLAKELENRKLDPTSFFSLKHGETRIF
eukprot:TRINITY_DN5094_c0_g1_i3.p1 TRINITY_DN5094_c0_g1~~TRINITY_DN5094_c0_g1_i3.p1  ORF type:complete len:460 (-),score=118.82 TRINITY_DN5094_c0_g1_i3:817-2196(-)